MAPYSPPTGDALGKCASTSTRTPSAVLPASSQFLRDQITEARLSVYPDYTRRHTKLWRRIFGVEPIADSCSPTAPTKPSRCSSTPTWTTVTKSCFCGRPMPCTASMPKWPARRIREIDYRAARISVSAGAIAGRHHPAHQGDPDRQSQQPHRHRNHARPQSSASCKPRAACRRPDRRSLLRILRRHRATLI